MNEKRKTLESISRCRIMTIVWRKPFCPFLLLLISPHFTSSHIAPLLRSFTKRIVFFFTAHSIYSGFNFVFVSLNIYSTNILWAQIISNIQKQPSNADHSVKKELPISRQSAASPTRNLDGYLHGMDFVYECEITAATLNGIDPNDLKSSKFHSKPKMIWYGAYKP